MSIFIKNLKTITTNITGNELKLKINVAVWLYLDQEYGIKQGQFAEYYAKERNLTTAKFVAAVFKANKYDVSLEEIVENVTEGELEAFCEQYLQMNMQDIEENTANNEGKEIAN